MTASNEVIVTAFEKLGLTPDQIADDQGFDIVAVKSILQQNSALYRKQMKTDSSLDFTDGEGEEAKAVLLSLMRYSEDENLRGRLAQYVINDKKGRLDVERAPSGLNINVNLFQQHLQQALSAVDRAKTATVKTIVNLEPKAIDA